MNRPNYESDDSACLIRPIREAEYHKYMNKYAPDLPDSPDSPDSLVICKIRITDLIYESSESRSESNQPPDSPNS